MKPDKTEKSVRFGCGFTFGLLMGFFSTAQYVCNSAGGIAVVAFATAVVCGLLAMRYGDSFWENLRKWLWW